MAFMKINSFIALLLCTLLLLTGCSFDEELPESSAPPPSSSVSDISVSDEVSEEIVIPAITEIIFSDIPSAAIYEADGLRPIYEQNVHEKRSPASLTKLVTASVALKYVSPETVYTVGSELGFVAWDSSVCGIQRGQRLSLYDLLTGLLMCSGNDAAYTIAVNVARDVSEEELSDKEAVEYFCGLMNGFTASIGMVESNFETPDGYEAEGQFTTASDLAKVSEYAMNVEIIAEIASQPQKTVTVASGDTFEWMNSNFFLHAEMAYYNPHVTGLKTGSTSAAGKCLVSTVEIEGKGYIVIVLGCLNDEQRYGYSQDLIEYLELHSKK